MTITSPPTICPRQSGAVDDPGVEQMVGDVDDVVDGAHLWWRVRPWAIWAIPLRWRPSRSRRGSADTRRVVDSYCHSTLRGLDGKAFDRRTGEGEASA